MKKKIDTADFVDYMQKKKSIQLFEAAFMRLRK